MINEEEFEARKQEIYAEVEAYFKRIEDLRNKVDWLMKNRYVYKTSRAWWFTAEERDRFILPDEDMHVLFDILKLKIEESELTYDWTWDKRFGMVKKPRFKTNIGRFILK